MVKSLWMTMIGLWVCFAVVGCDSRKGNQSTAPAQQAGSGGSGATALMLDLGNGATMAMVEISAGKFLMGSSEAEPGRGDDETQHEVTISKPFHIGATHVTVDQFAAFAKASGYKTDAEKDGWSNGFEIKGGKLDFKKVDGCSWRNPGFDQKSNHPVVQVSWLDAKAFCDWLSKKSGKTVSLPTEAQWEYACRAGTKTAYPWGDNPDEGKGWANCSDQKLKKTFPNAPAEVMFFNWDDGFVFTSPTASFKANGFGLYDMNGNVMQWCLDQYRPHGDGPTTDPIGAAPGRRRVLRGGTWGNDPAHCRSAGRIPTDSVSRLGYVGFRVVVLQAGVD